MRGGPADAHEDRGVEEGPIPRCMKRATERSTSRSERSMS